MEINLITECNYSVKQETDLSKSNFPIKDNLLS